MKELGLEPPTEEALEETFKNIDYDKSGTIDYDEFKRWFFRGMKTYDKNTRTLLKLTSKANGLLDQVNLTKYENEGDSDEEKMNYEVNKHTLALTFNE